MSNSPAAARDSLRLRRYPRRLFLDYQKNVVDVSADGPPRRLPTAAASKDPNEELSFAAWWRESGQSPKNS
ncbi:hypothetical protein [Nocardioides sp. zg-DK7169]|uniref:hypothetical protein n=1 Tax=Nocardioides sp. zg-DK7169 TaxID=2736600 RepID=UPI001556C6A7|nr:hypothetical protein [Nocardioides sp. zg-DK7169]NPC96174.1 hypothetical protein [Nocardioides sp. zg-DK7169]